MNRDGLLAICAYNAYANHLVLNTVKHLSADELTRPSSPSHESVLKMLWHMLAVEANFLARCQGTAIERPDLPTLAEVARYWSEIERSTQYFIAAQSDDDLAREVIAFTDRSLHFPVWQLLLQACLHSTHHRGELSVVLTELSYPLPTLDIIVHFAEQSGQVWPWK
ncbi:MAG: DinB family protein [Chloroflexi bacterium]|nr:DinB family protein [Chloroflexota bacterium]